MTSGSGTPYAVFRHARALLPALLAVGTLGCQPRELSWERDGVRYVKRVDDESVDEEIVDRVIEHRRVLSEYLGLETPKGELLRYHKYLDREDLRRRSHCSAASSGCFFREHGVESRQGLDGHELIHAYTAHLGDKPKLIEEGLSEALSCRNELVVGVDLDLQTAWSRSAWESVRLRDIDNLYRGGAMFVAFLLQRHGTAKFRDFYTALASSDEGPQVAVHFERIYGMPLVDVWHQALARRGSDSACAYALECAAPPLALGASGLGPGDAAGSLAGALAPGARTFASDGMTLLSLASTGGGKDLRLGPCGGAHLEDDDFARSPRAEIAGSAHLIALGTGRYWFEGAEAAAVERITRFIDIESSCLTLMPIDVPIHADLLLGMSAESMKGLSKEDQPGEWGSLTLKLAGAGGVRLDCSPGVRAEVCESCDYTRCQAACETGHANDVTLLARGTVLRLHVVEGQGFWMRIRAHSL